MAALSAHAVTALAIGSIYALMALGLTMTYGVLRVLHIAHGAVYTLGAYVGLLAFRATGSFLTALAAAGIACGIAGALLYLLVYRPMLPLPRYVPLIASIGLLIFLQDLYRLIWGPYTLPFAAPFSSAPLRLGSLAITPAQLVVMAVAAALLAAVWWLLHRTRLGLAWRAAAEDLEIAGTMGVSLHKALAANLLVGSALAGAAGTLVGMYYGEVAPTMGFVPSYKGFVIIILGGMGNVLGTVVASFLLGFSETFVVAWAGYLLPRDAIAFLVMLVLLAFRPTGLFASH